MTDDLWTATQCAGWLSENGRPMQAASWRRKASRGQGVAPAKHSLGRPLWDPEAVRDWHARGPQQGRRTDLKREPK